MSTTTLNVTLTPELKDLVEAKVRSGRYQDSSEVVREALRALEEGQNQTEDPALERLIDEGLASGPGRRLTPGVWREIWTRGDQIARASRRRARKAA
jgi:antitoxin ParD1/3/4